MLALDTPHALSERVPTQYHVCVQEEKMLILRDGCPEISLSTNISFASLD
jgi:hypothetical protein